MDDTHGRSSEEARRLLQPLGARLVDLDRDDLAREHGRLAARCGAEVERPLAGQRADRVADELRSAALRPDPALGDGLLVHPVDDPRSGDQRVLDTVY